MALYQGPLFDADNHFYEAHDAFIRHVPRRMQHRCVEWVELAGGRKYQVVGGRIDRSGNPTFNPISKPGVLRELFRGNPRGMTSAELIRSSLEPMPPEYMDRDARIARMDEQGLDGAWLFPTLGVLYEEPLKKDVDAVCTTFNAFNQWLEEDWGFNYKGRSFTSPYISLADVDWACRELEWALERDARLLVLRPSAVCTRDGWFSPGDERFDPFWARVNEAGITVAYHSGDSGYFKFQEAWGLGKEFKAFDFDPVRLCMSASPVHDLMATLLCGGLFDRHRNLRIATIETGSSWVSPLLTKLKKAYGQMPFAFRQDPVEAFRRHVWVAPYDEDSLLELRDAIGIDHMLFGSDFPHGEGLAEPIDFRNDLEGFGKDEVRQIMRENGLGLVRPQSA